MVSISSTLRVLIMQIFVPMRTEHESREMTRNINVKTWISGDLLVSVMIFCVGCIFGEAMAIRVTMIEKQNSQATGLRETMTMESEQIATMIAGEKGNEENQWP
jgi:ABC-type phosphate transport system permease subunit